MQSFIIELIKKLTEKDQKRIDYLKSELISKRNDGWNEEARTKKILNTLRDADPEVFNPTYSRRLSKFLQFDFSLLLCGNSCANSRKLG